MRRSDDRCYHEKGFKRDTTTHSISGFRVDEFVCKQGCGYRYRTANGKHWPWRDRRRKVDAA